jgi:hypothetical protein
VRLDVIASKYSYCSVCPPFKNFYCSKAWRRIIPFGLSATRVTKGGRRNIPFGLPIVRRKSQPSTFPNPGMIGIGDVTRHVTIRRMTRRKLENEKKVWRRIITFGLSATSDSKGGCQNILVGLPYVRQKS